MNAIVLWTMHPWERDAHLAKEALIKGHFGVLIEIACSRSSEELLGARKAYHSLYEQSLEEDVDALATGIQRKLLVALMSSYRYEGPKVNDETAKKDAKILYNSVKDRDKKVVEDEEVVRILATRSKPHIKAVAEHYKEISGNSFEEDPDLDMTLTQTLQCLCTPEAYFSKILEEVLNKGIDDDEDLSRVIVTRADVDMNKIKERYEESYGSDLRIKIQESVNGNYRDFLLTLVARGD